MAVQTLNRKRKNYQQFWNNLIENVSKIKVGIFNVDVDDLPKRVVLNIAKRITKSFPCQKVEVWQSENKPKNFHLKVVLTEPMEIWKTFLARLLAYDDPKRIRLDAIRCGNNQPNLIDYISIIKLQYDQQNRKLTLISKYHKIAEIKSEKKND